MPIKKNNRLVLKHVNEEAASFTPRNNFLSDGVGAVPLDPFRDRDEKKLDRQDSSLSPGQGNLVNKNVITITAPRRPNNWATKLRESIEEVVINLRMSVE